MSNDKRRQYSSQVVDGITKAPARAMLRAVGFTDEDFKKPQVGIASTWSNLTPCNMHIDKLAVEAGHGADEADDPGPRGPQPQGLRQLQDGSVQGGRGVAQGQGHRQVGVV